MNRLVEIIRRHSQEMNCGLFTKASFDVFKLSSLIKDNHKRLPEATVQEKTKLGDALVDAFPGRYTTAPDGGAALLPQLEVLAWAYNQSTDAFAKLYFQNYFTAYGLKMIAEGKAMQERGMDALLTNLESIHLKLLEPFWGDKPLLDGFAMLVFMAFKKWSGVKVEGQQAWENELGYKLTLMKSVPSIVEKAAVACQIRETAEITYARMRAVDIFAHHYSAFFRRGLVSRYSLGVDNHPGTVLGFFELLSAKTGYRYFDVEKGELKKEMLLDADVRSATIPQPSDSGRS